MYGLSGHTTDNKRYAGWKELLESGRKVYALTGFAV